MLINAIFIYFIGEIVTATDRNINKTVEELEKEKKYLFKQINVAIDESVKSLQKANDSGSLVGLKYMQDLREHMKKVDETEINDTDVNNLSAPNLDNRRKIKEILDPKNWKSKTTTPKDIFDFEAILKPSKKIKTWQWKEIVETRQKMQKKLDEWLLERQREKDLLEKKKLQKKRLKISGAYEKCPRFGFQGRKKKKDHSIDKIKLPPCKKCESDKKEKNNTSDIKPKRKRISQKLQYPCCRKCCKKSYLGCL